MFSLPRSTGKGRGVKRRQMLPTHSEVAVFLAAATANPCQQLPVLLPQLSALIPSPWEPLSGMLSILPSQHEGMGQSHGKPKSAPTASQYHQHP